ncbi:hypothetical protein AAG906_024623 [Vitis piasezkii]
MLWLSTHPLLPQPYIPFQIFTPFFFFYICTYAFTCRQISFSLSHSWKLFSLKKPILHCHSSYNLKDYREQKGCVLPYEENLRRRLLLFFWSHQAVFQLHLLLQRQRRIQKENNAPEDFPSFVREDFEVGKGDCPKAGQQVTFHYVGYNESGRRIDSSYMQGSPAKIRMGTNALVPGFEEGIRDMKPGGKRRIIIPPELGPPVGPSTFFSSKQFEVFDVELLNVKDCQRRTIGFYSDVVCE